MSTLDQSYKAYSFANHKEVYLALEKCFVHFGIKYYLIGANARDVQLYKAGVKPNRGTADIDFAIMLPDIEKYNALRTNNQNWKWSTPRGGKGEYKESGDKFNKRPKCY